MFKKLFLVALFTGLSQLLMFFSVFYLSTKIQSEYIGKIAIIDSALILITTILSFGLQLSVNREIALIENWKPYFYKAQSARFTVSIFLSVYGLIMWFLTRDVFNVIFIFSPFIALNADYALYGKGYAEKAAFISFLRVLIPSVSLLISGLFFLELMVVIYVVSILVGILLAGLLSSISLETVYIVKMDKNFLTPYKQNLKVGAFQLSTSFIQSGTIFLAQYFGYKPNQLGEIYPLLKIYELVKGGYRIVIQSVFIKLKNIDLILIIEKLAIFLGVMILLVLNFYYDFVMQLLFDNIENVPFTIHQVQIFSLLILFTSVKITSDTYALLTRKDNENLFISFGSLFIGFASLACFSILNLKQYGILISIMLIEFSFFVLYSIYTDNKIVVKYKFQLFATLFFTLTLIYFVCIRFLSLQMTHVIVCLFFLFISFYTLFKIVKNKIYEF